MNLTSLLCKYLNNAITTCNLAALHFSYTHSRTAMLTADRIWAENIGCLKQQQQQNYAFYFSRLVHFNIKSEILSRYISKWCVFVCLLKTRFHCFVFRKNIDFSSFIASIPIKKALNGTSQTIKRNPDRTKPNRAI